MMVDVMLPQQEATAQKQDIKMERGEGMRGREGGGGREGES